MSTPAEPTILIVPGLRDESPDHWQSLLARRLHRVHSVPAMGRTDLDRTRRVQAIDDAVQSIDGPLIAVAHSGGVIALVHWAQNARRPLHSALLAAPPDFDTPMPEGYPAYAALRSANWFPVPRGPLPFPTIAALSRNDPLGRFDTIATLARGWGSRIVDLGPVGHLNPASGYGDWRGADDLIDELAATTAYCRLKCRLRA